MSTGNPFKSSSIPLTKSLTTPLPPSPLLNSHQRECVAGRVERVFDLPQDCSPDQAKATLEHGVLVVSFPKRADAAQAQASNRRNLAISSEQVIPTAGQGQGQGQGQDGGSIGGAQGRGKR